MSRIKKQFRLYDVYRYAATGVESKIEGIHSYECNKDATTLTVRFGEYAVSQFWFPRDEKELREVIHEVNKRLGNCAKPGKKRYHAMSEHDRLITYERRKCTLALTAKDPADYERKLKKLTEELGL